MAHTDSCKHQVCQFVGKLTKEGMSVNQACKETEIESDGIPSETIRRWWKEIQKDTERELVKNDQPMGADEKPPVTPPSDSETQTDSSSPEESSSPPATPVPLPEDPLPPPESPEPDKPTHGGKRKGAGKPMTEKQEKAKHNKFWISIAKRINKLADNISEKGSFPIKENAKEETVAEIREALNLITEYLKGVQ